MSLTMYRKSGADSDLASFANQAQLKQSALKFGASALRPARVERVRTPPDGIYIPPTGGVRTTPDGIYIYRLPAEYDHCLTKYIYRLPEEYEQRLTEYIYRQPE